jgi:hypothetical protein
MRHKENIDHLIESFVERERNTASNPFLSTRVMAAIDQERNSKWLFLSPVWRTAVLALSLLVAVFAGMVTGNLYQTKNDAIDVVLINDDKMENFGLYNEVSNELIPER